MRTPQDVTARPARSRGRARWWIIGAVVVLIILLASLRSLATLYTDSLWFSSVKLHGVWSTLLAVKVGLFAAFGAAFFFILWINLVVCDRLASTHPDPSAEDELVRRYQHVVRPYAGRLYIGLSVVLALIAASGTIGEWRNWILFTHSQSFSGTDPEFHKNIGFYVFDLPFLQFLVNWALVSLVVVLVITAIFHYLNGGIRAQRVSPRVRPNVKSHLSVLLALIALVKAAGYLLQRWDLVVSNNGYVTGAGYSDVHARLPALELLFFISIAAAVILLYNIRRQGWTLPVLAIGIWAFVALVIGVIYPAVLQALKVNPAQSTLELPYIKENINATRTAYGLDNVGAAPFAGNSSVNQTLSESDIDTLNNIRLWDPDPNISLQTYQKQQEITSYYTFQALGVDRYNIDGKLTPALVGVRQLNAQNLPSTGWVNTHLQYTHGQGAVLGLANQTKSNGNPVYGIDNIPASSSAGLPKIDQLGVYFGLNDPGYVVVHSAQPENDYSPTNPNGSTRYEGTGGVALSSFFTRLAFAVRLGDLNLLISNLVTPDSRIMFVRDIQQMVQKAAPFLSFDSDPYGVIVNGHIDWVVDAYTTTSMYPYSQDSDSQQVPPGSGLPGNYNYVRNSVKVVIDAYSGHMTFYAMDPNDPILRAYASAFPGMFTPASKMSSALADHLRYPEDMFSMQTAIYGRYHLTNPSDFYNAANAWIISPTVGAGSPSDNLQTTTLINAQGVQIQGPQQRMAPIYQVLAEPGQPNQAFTITDAYVPTSSNGQGGNQHLTAFMMATPPRPGEPGKLSAYVLQSQQINGPVQADSAMQQDPTVSSQTTLLNKEGSQVLLGNTLMLPVDQSILYVRPLYVAATSNPIPRLAYVVATLGNIGSPVAFQTSLQAAVAQALNTVVPGNSAATSSPTGGESVTSSVAAQVASLLKQAQADYQAAQTALENGDLATYQQQIADMEKAISQAQALLATSGGSSTPSSTTTTTTAPRTSATTAPKNKAPTKGTSSSSTTIGIGSSLAGTGSTTTTTTPGEA